MKKLKFAEIIITLILLMGQLIPSTVLAKANLSTNKITATSKVMNSSSAVSKVAESNANISNMMSSSEYVKGMSQQSQKNTESDLKKTNLLKNNSKVSDVANYFKWKEDWQKNQSLIFSVKNIKGTGGSGTSDKFPFSLHTENEIEVNGIGDTVPQLTVGESSFWLRTSKNQPLRPKFTALPDTMKWTFKPALAPWIDIPNNENGVFDSNNIRGVIGFDDWPLQGEHASGFAFASRPDSKNVLYNFTSKNPSKVNVNTDGYVNYDDNNVPPPPNGAPRYIFSIDNRVYYPQIIRVQYRDIDNPGNLLSDETVGNGEVYGSQVNVGYNILPGFNFVNSQIVDGVQQRYTSAAVNATVNKFSYTGEPTPEEVTDNKNIDLTLDNQQKGIIFWVKKQIPETSTHIYNRHNEEITDDRFVHNFQHVRYRFSIKNTSGKSISSVDFKNSLPEKSKYIQNTGYAWVGDDNSPKNKPEKPEKFSFGTADDLGVDSDEISGTYKGEISEGQTLTIEYECEVHPMANGTDDSDITNGGKGISSVTNPKNEHYGETIFTIDGDTYNPPAITRKKKSFFTAMTKDIRNETKTPKDQDGWVNGDGYKRISIFGQPGDIINYRLKVGVTAMSSEDIDLSQKDPVDSKTVANAIKDVLDSDLTLLSDSEHPVQATYPDSSDGTGPDDATGFNVDGYHLVDSLNPMKDDKEHDVILTFSAKVKDSVEKEIIPNQANFMGRNPLTDFSNKGNNRNEKNSNEADVRDGGAGLNKKVKNETASDTAYTESTSARVGDIIDYQLVFTPPEGGSYKPAKIVDKLDSRLDYVPGSLKIGEDTLPDSNFNNSTLSVDLAPGVDPVSKPVIVTFKAKVNSTVEDDSLIHNYGIFSGTEKINGTIIGKVEEVSNDASIKISSKGQVIIRYVDRKTSKLIKAATTDNTGQETFTDRIGSSIKVQPKDLGQLGYTVVDSSDINADIGAITDWKQPATDYDLKFDNNVQVITYRYEKSRIGLVVPILWDFGKFNVASVDRTYFLDDRTKSPQSVNVIDYYTTKNWKLSVKQLGQFKGTVTTNYSSNGQAITKDYYLDNAKMHLNNGNVTLTDNDAVAEANKGNVTTFGDQTLDPNATQPTELMTTNFSGGESNGKYATHGFGVWHYNFGDKSTADHSIGLHIPETTKRQKTEYKTKLEWTLTVAE